MKRLDVEHFIEISEDLNAAQGYNAYRLLKDVLIERRVIKDRISELQSMVDMITSSSKISTTRVNQINDAIDKKINHNLNEEGRRKYRVGIMTDVFGDTIQSRNS